MTENTQTRPGEQSWTVTLATLASWKLQQEVTGPKAIDFAASLCHRQMGILGQQGKVLTELSFEWWEPKSRETGEGTQENSRCS